MLSRFHLISYRNVTDGQTDWRTDRQTDRKTEDKIAISLLRVSVLTRDKNSRLSTCIWPTTAGSNVPSTSDGRPMRPIVLTIDALCTNAALPLSSGSGVYQTMMQKCTKMQHLLLIMDSLAATAP